MSRNRIWAKLNTDFFRNQKIVSMSPYAILAYQEMLLWSKEQMTDGVVPEAVADQIVAKWVRVQMERETEYESYTTTYTNRIRLVYEEICANVALDAKQAQLVARHNVTKGAFYELHDFVAVQGSRATTERKARQNAENVKKRWRKTSDTTRIRTEYESNTNRTGDTDTDTDISKTDVLDIDAQPALPAAPDAPVARPSDKYPKAFETFWTIYPKHQDKRRALKAWQQATRRASTEAINEGATRYRDDPNRVDRFTKHAESWLNADGWLNDPLSDLDQPRQPRGAPSQPMTTTSQRVQGWLALSTQNPPTEGNPDAPRRLTA